MKNIVLLGATGSIGDSCLNVIRQNKKHFHLFGIGLGGNLDKATNGFSGHERTPFEIYFSRAYVSKPSDIVLRMRCSTATSLSTTISWNDLATVF